MKLLCLLLALVLADDQGMILFFETECPSGWDDYRPADDHFILPTSHEQELLQQGGVSQITLSE